MVDKRRELGLKAIKGARDDRERTKFGRITPRVWVFAAASILSTMVVARMYSGRELGNAKETLLQKQRAADKTVGARWYPLRDRIESFTVDAAKAYKGDLVTPEAATLNFRTLPGIYLRLRTADAQSVESIHKVAPESVKMASRAACCARATTRRPEASPTRARRPISRGTCVRHTRRRAS